MKNPTKKLLDTADADIMDWVYEVVKINFDATLVQDSTELRAILQDALESAYDVGRKETFEKVMLFQFPPCIKTAAQISGARLLMEAIGESLKK